LEESGKSIFGGHNYDDMAAFYKERAENNVGLIVTGGVSPNHEGRVFMGASDMTSKKDAKNHMVVTDAVHSVGGKIAMQILHAGRYAYHANSVSASAIKSPISIATPKELSSADVTRTIADYIKCAEYAKMAGYDGVEVMGSEGYFINQFIICLFFHINMTNFYCDNCSLWIPAGTHSYLCYCQLPIVCVAYRKLYNLSLYFENQKRKQITMHLLTNTMTLCF
jgi:hypothetical protein